MKDNRPVNLNLFTIRFPLPAIASILHRISGFILFLFIPVILWALHDSLASQQTYDSLHDALTTPIAKFLLWGVGSAFLFHFVAGIRHLLMDINLGVSLKGGRFGALITLIIAAALIILMGIRIW